MQPSRLRRSVLASTWPLPAAELAVVTDAARRFAVAPSGAIPDNSSSRHAEGVHSHDVILMAGRDEGTGAFKSN
jgi:hypothetical protein